MVSDPASGNVITPPGFDGLLGGATYTSFVNGKSLPEAWNVVLDIPVIDVGTSQGFSLLEVSGISIQEIQQANDLIGKNIEIYGGMQKGLPLANPAQAGLLVKGVVYQCYGNWIGTDMTLNFVISPGAAMGDNTGGIGTLAKPKNLTLNWPSGRPLADALKSALQTGFPGYTVNVNISANIVRPNAQPGFYPTLGQLAQFCRETSLSIIKTPGYGGIRIVPNGTTIDVTDAPASKVTQIAFEDLIGQPTWIESPNISIKTVMRSDLGVQSSIMLPPTLITNTAAAMSSLVNQRASFQGGFYVISARHVGNFRQPSADAWVTVLEASPNKIVGTT